MRTEKNWTPFDYCPNCTFHHGAVVNHTQCAHEPVNALTTHLSGNEISERVHLCNASTNTHVSPMSSSFTAEPTLLFIYSVNPHIIVQTHELKDNEMRADPIFTTELLRNDWRWGEMRGGTPAVLINDHSYLTFFHSSGQFDHKNVTTYVMGAYLFERNPPFAITHMSAEPIMHESFMSGEWTYSTLDYVIFPAGIIIDSKHIYVSYGRNNNDSWILTLDRKGLLDSLKPVQTKVTGRSQFNSQSGKIDKTSFNLITGGDNAVSKQISTHDDD